MKKIILASLLIILFGFGCTTKPITPTNSTQPQAMTYGSISGFFTGQDVIYYPTILNNISVDKTSPNVSLNFYSNDKILNYFKIDMNVTKMAKKTASTAKSDLIERGYVSNGSKTTTNGYVGEIISHDAKKSSTTGSQFQTCGFGYRYYIPLITNDDELELNLWTGQPGWNDPDVPNSSECKIFTDENYNYLKSMMDYVIDNFEPAF